MVFSFGGEQHLYVMLDGDLKRSMWRAKELCVEHKVRISAFFDQMVGSVKDVEERFAKIVGSLPKDEQADSVQKNVTESTSPG